MPYCFAPGCNHGYGMQYGMHASRRETCRFFRFPANKQVFGKNEKLSNDLLKIFILCTLTKPASPSPHWRWFNDSEQTKPCSLLDFMETASCSVNLTELVCDGGFTSEWTKGVKSEVQHLRVRNWPGECFNVGRLQQHFPELTLLEFINCTALAVFKGHFDASCKIQKLVMHGLTSLWEVPPELVVKMPALKEVDLRGNMLRHMKARFVREPPRLQRVLLSDNDWDCSDSGLDWLAKDRQNTSDRRKIGDYYHMVCHQQLYRGKPLHKVMDIIWMVHTTCPAPCSCAMTHVVSDRAGGLLPLITVNCSARMLAEPPATLPPHTSTLLVDRNKINTVRGIIQNAHYKKLADLYLDNNSISTVKEFEASEWFTTFRVLSLRGNKLKQIPVYAFDKAFQGNNNIMHVFLGHNPWRCDCHFIPRFQGLLLKYKRVIRDLPDIKCSKSEDKLLSLVQISTMPLGNVCRSGLEMPLSPINIVNVCLFALIIFVLGRFLYDWHQYKTTGKLPWISSILP